MSTATLFDQDPVTIGWRAYYTPAADRDREKVVSEITATRRQQLIAVLTATQPVIRGRHPLLMKRLWGHSRDHYGPYWFTRPSRKKSFEAMVILGTATVDDFKDLLVRGDVARWQLAVFLLHTKKLAFEVVSRIERALNRHAASKQGRQLPVQVPDPNAQKLDKFWRAIEAEELWCSTTIVEPIAAAIQDDTFAELWRDGKIGHVLIDKLLQAGLLDAKYLAALNLSVLPDVVEIDESEAIPPGVLPDLDRLNTTGELNLLLIKAALNGEVIPA